MWPLWLQCKYQHCFEASHNFKAQCGHCQTQLSHSTNTYNINVSTYPPGVQYEKPKCWTALLKPLPSITEIHWFYMNKYCNIVMAGHLKPSWIFKSLWWLFPWINQKEKERNLPTDSSFWKILKYSLTRYRIAKAESVQDWFGRYQEYDEEQEQLYPLQNYISFNKKKNH